MKPLAALAIALALTACTAPAPSDAPTPSGTSAAGPAKPTPQSRAAPLPSATRVPAAQVDPPDDRRVITASPDGRTLQVPVKGGGCRVASVGITAQTADRVTLALVTTRVTPPDGRCTDDNPAIPVDVVLDAPLGARRLALDVREQR
ncbi:hypothetical protein [Actinosynnema sp. NPDC020468]|uniref:hypothetical protein n=1 Tax=Actinosynnema sp. NPDC020468 TaxID=3154488 RepID=UPI00340F4870